MVCLVELVSFTKIGLLVLNGLAILGSFFHLDSSCHRGGDKSDRIADTATLSHLCNIKDTHGWEAGAGGVSPHPLNWAVVLLVLCWQFKPGLSHPCPDCVRVALPLPSEDRWADLLLHALEDNLLALLRGQVLRLVEARSCLQDHDSSISTILSVAFTTWHLTRLNGLVCLRQ